MYISVCISVCDCFNKLPQTRWLKQQKFILSQFWRLEVQNHYHLAEIKESARLCSLQSL